MCPPTHSRKPPRGPVDDEDEPTQIGTVDRSFFRAQSRRDRAYLIVLAGENLGQMFPVRDSETVIGRAADAAVRLKDDGVSRRHAKIVQKGGDVVVEDLNSANGTLVNGQRVAQAVLHDGDKIQVGSTTILKFTYADRLEEDFQQKMYEAALHDGLTRAYTKRYFLDRMPTEIAYARRHSTPLSLLMIDVDHFKKINDTHGHLAGDYVLVVLSQAIATSLRTEDIFARYGGEEFCVLCRGVTLEHAALLAERLRARVETAAFEYQQTPIPVTVSVGVASYVEHPDAGTQLDRRGGRGALPGEAIGSEPRGPFDLAPLSAARAFAHVVPAAPTVAMGSAHPFDRDPLGGESAALRGSAHRRLQRGQQDRFHPIPFSRMPSVWPRNRTLSKGPGMAESIESASRTARRGSTGSRRRDLPSMWARTRRSWFARSGAC